MLRRPAVTIVVSVLVALATLPTADPARASASCTGWTDRLSPPRTIRVYRTEGPSTGRVQVVDFRRYVEVVMAAEWPSSWPLHTLRAGAVAVKQYAWYFTMRYRGGKNRDGACYDVVDYWADQVYDPEDKTPAPTHIKVVTQTWDISLRQGSGFFATGYRAYNPGWDRPAPCGADDDAHERIYQWSAQNCGTRGRTMETIWRTYYAPGTLIAEPGAHNIVGDRTRHGDGSVMLPGPDADSFRVRLYESGGASFVSMRESTVLIPRRSIRAALSADVTGDRREDLVLLVTTSPGVQSLYVLRATGIGYAAPARWWFTDPGELRVAGIDLLAGDFDGDDRTDAALLVTDKADASRSILYLLHSMGGAFSSKRVIWSGALNNLYARGIAGDANGDGRADLLIQIDRGGNGLDFHVAPSDLDGGALGPRLRWFRAPGWRALKSQIVTGDLDRDGRADLLIARPKGPAGTFLTLLRSTGLAFAATNVWASDQLPYARLKITAGDATGDGRDDVVGYARLDTGKTRIHMFRSLGASLKRTIWREEPAVAWPDVSPY